MISQYANNQASNFQVAVYANSTLTLNNASAWRQAMLVISIRTGECLLHYSCTLLSDNNEHYTETLSSVCWRAAVGIQRSKNDLFTAITNLITASLRNFPSLPINCVNPEEFWHILEEQVSNKPRYNVSDIK